MSTATETVTKTKLSKPKMYKVELLNDNYTTMDFVMYVLVTIFNKTEGEAYDLMMNVHEKGKGLAGVYTKEIAEQKVHETDKAAAQEGHPLKTKMSPE